MFNSTNNNQGGFFKFIILIVVAILILSYFHIDLRSVVESPQSQSNIHYIWGFVVNIWSGYLAKPAAYLWNDIFIKLLWNSFIDNLNRIKNGRATSIEKLAPQTVPIQ